MLEAFKVKHKADPVYVRLADARIEELKTHQPAGTVTTPTRQDEPPKVDRPNQPETVPNAAAPAPLITPAPSAKKPSLAVKPAPQPASPAGPKIAMIETPQHTAPPGKTRCSK